MKHEIHPDLLKLADTADRAELLWCAAVASFVDFTADSFEMRVMARAINTAINIAVRELMTKRPDHGGGQ